MKNILYTILALSVLLLSACEDSAGENGLSTGSGKGGSMAQFTNYSGHLYLLEEEELQVYSLANPAAPQHRNTLVVGQDAETLFPYNGHLFVGTQNGMRIYSLEDPALPVLVTDFVHVTSCDPVVVEGNFAYLTLRSGTACNFGVNELQIINISDITRPVLTYQMPMPHPQGLAINERTLFVCNGDQGLTVLDVNNPYAPVLLKEYRDYNGYDVIFTSRSLMMIGSDGLVQYDATDPANLRQLSIIPVSPAL